METEVHEKLVEAENDPNLVVVVLASDSSSWFVLKDATVLFVTKAALAEAKITGAVPEAVFSAPVKIIVPEWEDAGG